MSKETEQADAHRAYSEFVERAWDHHLREARLLTLPRRQRAIVVLRHYADLSEKEVAAALDCSVGTVKSQNARALLRLREALKGVTL